MVVCSFNLIAAFSYKENAVLEESFVPYGISGLNRLPIFTLFVLAI
jgi:hypothetical protein